MRQQGEPAGELMIPCRELRLLPVTTDLPSHLDAEGALFHNEVQILFVLSELKKSMCVLQYQSFSIVSLADFHFCSQFPLLFQPPAFESFVPIDTNVTGHRVSMISSRIHCGSQPFLNPQRVSSVQLRWCVWIKMKSVCHISFSGIFIAPRT